MKLTYHWNASYQTLDRYSRYARLKATTREGAIIEAQQLPNFKRLYEVFRRSEEALSKG